MSSDSLTFHAAVGGQASKPLEDIGTTPTLSNTILLEIMSAELQVENT